MTLGTKPPQLHPLPILNLLGVAVAPLDGHLGRRVGIHQDVEGAVAALELGEEGHGGGDLPEDGGDLGLDLGFGLFFGGFFGGVVFLVGGFWGGGRFGGFGFGGFGFGLGEYLDLCWEEK